MDREEWETSNSALRKLLKTYREAGGEDSVDRICEYKFGLCWNPQYGLHHLWNGIAKNTMATFRVTDDKVILRYRKNSFYKDELFKFKMPDYETVLVPSDTLSRHRDWVNHRIQARVGMRIEEVRDFLALQRRQDGVSSNTRVTNLRHVGTDRLSRELYSFHLRYSLVGQNIEHERRLMVRYQTRPSQIILQETWLMIRSLNNNGTPPWTGVMSNEPVEFLDLLNSANLSQFARQSVPSRLGAIAGEPTGLAGRITAEFAAAYQGRVQDVPF